VPSLAPSSLIASSTVEAHFSLGAFVFALATSSPSPLPISNSALIKASFISFRSEVSIFLGESADEAEGPEVALIVLNKDLAVAKTPLAAEEYNIFCLMGDEVGQAYINTVDFLNW